MNETWWDNLKLYVIGVGYLQTTLWRSTQYQHFSFLFQGSVSPLIIPFSHFPTEAAGKALQDEINNQGHTGEALFIPCDLTKEEDIKVITCWCILAIKAVRVTEWCFHPSHSRKWWMQQLRTLAESTVLLTMQDGVSLFASVTVVSDRVQKGVNCQPLVF